MKFKDISERVKGGKLDPLSKMGRSKLTGQEIATYYRQNPKAKQAAKDPMVKKAIELALDLGGNQTLAMKEIEKMKRGLSKNPAVASALRTANEDMTSTSSVAMPEIPLGRKHKVMKRKDLEEGKAENKKAQIERIQLMRKVKITTRGQKTALADLLAMTSSKVLEGMFKRNPRGFVTMLNKMNPKRDKLSKADYMVDGQFVAPSGSLLTKDQTKELNESTELNEASVTYRIRKAQKPEIDNMMKGARMMKLKVTGNRVKTVGADPKRKTGDTEITVSGTAKNLRDFDAVVRGKSSYGDPSVVEDAVERAKELADLKAKHKREVEQEKDEIERTKQSASAESVLAQLDALEEQIDLLEKQYAIRPDMDWTAPFSPKYRKKHRKSAPGSIKNKEEIVAMIRKKKDGKHKIKDGNTSLIVRSLARMMNQDRKGARDKGAAFGKGDPKDEMDAPKIKKMIDIVSKGITVTKKGDKITRNAPEINAFTNVDTAVRDDVYQVINMASDGTLSSLVYNESTELNEESAVMKKVRQVVKKKSMMNIDGMKLDLTTASMIASVYDQVNPMNKKRMDKLKLPQLINLTMKVARGKSRKESTELQEGQTYKSIIQGLEKDKKEVASKSKAFRQNDTKYIDKAINFLKMLEKEGIPAGQISQVDFVTNRVPKFFIGPANRSPSLSKFTPNDVKKAVAHAKKLGIIKESTDLQEVTRQEVDAMKKVSKDMQKVLVSYQKIANVGDKELKDTKHNKEYKKVLDARDSILKMIGTLNTKMLLQKEAVSEAVPLVSKYTKKFQRTFTDKQPKSLDHFLRMIKSQEKATASSGIPTVKLLKKTKKGKNTVVDFMSGPNMQIKSIDNIMYNVKKKFKELEEAVSPAQQAAIAISKKERGEKPKNECADEKDFKPHKMYKGDKEVMANTYADHVKYDKMGYTHEKPKAEALDAKDKPFVKDLVKKLRGGSKTHAKQADDLEKATNTESMSRARRDAMRDMGKPTDRGDDDGYGVATKDDRKAADKNVVMQIRRVTDLSKPAQIELRNGKKVMLKPADAKMMMKKFDAIRKPQDRLKVQNAMNDKKMTVQGLKRLLGR